MKKLALTIAIVLGMTIGAFAQGGGLFGKGNALNDDDTREAGWVGALNVPGQHGLSGDQSAAPLGGGALLLIGFGAAYALKKRKK